MAVVQRLTKHYEGLSTDDKPTRVIQSTTFRETDTNAMYITHDGDNWIIADKRVRTMIYVVKGRETLTELTASKGFTAAQIPPTDPNVIYAVVQALDNNVRFCIDGTTPEAAKGILLTPGSSVEVWGKDALQNFKAIQEVASLPSWASALEFELGPRGGIARRSLTDRRSGKYSAYLSDEGYGVDWGVYEYGMGSIKLTMDMLLEHLIASQLSYWFKTLSPVPADVEVNPHTNPFPYMWFGLDTAGGHTPDASLVLHSGPADITWFPNQNEWIKWSPSCGWDMWHCGALRGAIGSYAAQLPNARILSCNVQVGQTVLSEYDLHIPIQGYVDDIKINGENFGFETARLEVIYMGQEG